MSLLKSLLLGRPDGLRASLRKRLFGGEERPRDAAAAAAAAREVQPVAAEASLGLKPEAPKDVTPPDGFEVVLHREALKPGKVTEIIIGGTAIAVANNNGAFLACANTCPHADGPLGEGTFEDGVLTCPYHGWQFDMASGQCKTNADAKVRVYQTAVVGDAVCVRL
jgi:nitrite reductase/ring-hydroxylating ferredoxin subunit